MAIFLVEVPYWFSVGIPSYCGFVSIFQVSLLQIWYNYNKKLKIIFSTAAHCFCGSAAQIEHGEDFCTSEIVNGPLKIEWVTVIVF